MENKISTSGLSAMLALATGMQQKICEDFVDEFFSLVGGELVRGENVRVKGFGTFKLVEVEPRKSVNVMTGEDYEIPGHSKIVFVMAKELAERVNTPFNAFEAVEIADDLPTDILDGEVEVEEEMIDTISESREEVILLNPGNTEETVEVVDVVEKSGPSEAAVAEDSMENSVEVSEDIQTALESASDNLIESTDNIVESADNIINESENQETVKTDSIPVEEKSFWQKYKFIIGFVAGLCVAFLIGWLVFGNYRIGKPGDNKNNSTVVGEMMVNSKNEESNESTEALTNSVGSVNPEVSTVAEETEEVPTKPSDSPVYDTVSTTRYLTTIAKDHYGNFNLWPIIYEENAAILGHPDRIVPGTRVVVPPLSKYNVDPNNTDQVNAIKQKGKAIYDKYK